MEIEGITWHGVTLEPDQFSVMKNLYRDVFGLTPMIEQDGLDAVPDAEGHRPRPL